MSSVRINPPACVYVIELEPAAARKARDRDAAERGAPVLYVGSTARDPRARLARHRQGGVSTATIVRRYGKRVVWASPFYSDRDSAEYAERDVAEQLRHAGAVVLGRPGSEAGRQKKDPSY